MEGLDIQNSRTERIGVNAVESIVLNEMGWIFREQPISDNGIDAHIEVCGSVGPTGRLIAAQIKSGESWFRHASRDGWLYRGSLRHLNYWMTHSLPVVLVLHRPSSNEAWWVPIEEDRVKILSRGWKVTVPQTLRFDKSAVTNLSYLAIPDFRRRRDVRATLGLTKDAAQVSGLSALVEALSAARSSVDLAFPYIDSGIYWVLKTISHRVRVRLIISPSVPTDVAEELLRWRDEAPSLETRVWLPPAGGLLFHAKFIIIDGVVAVYGSANLTRYSWRANKELVLAQDDTKVVSQLQNDFATLWSSAFRAEDVAKQHLLQLVSGNGLVARKPE